MSQNEAPSAFTSTVSVLRRAREDFAPAFKSTWPYTLIGLVAGATLITVGHVAFSVDSLPLLLLEHIGLGLIVSAVAVFFYEWGAHHKKVLDHSRRLTEIQAQLTDLVHARGMLALDLALDALLFRKSEVAAKVRKDLHNIVEGLSRLQQKDIWAKDGYIECLAEFIEIVQDNVYSLSSIDTPGDHRYTLANTLTADTILAVQMRELRAGDFYDVISHLESWTDGRLAKLHAESGKALKRGVRIRRLFNLVRDCSMLDKEVVREILRAHFADSVMLPGYEVKILLRRDLVSARHPLRQQIEGAQIALFAHESGTVRVKIYRVDLSELFISTSRAELRPDKVLFEEAWGIAEILTEDLIEECVELVFQGRDA